MPLRPTADLKDMLHQKWKCVSQCFNSASRATVCSLGLGMQKERNRRHLVFTYGTLKQGEPNHYHFLNAENGYARLIGTAKTVVRWPLIVTTKWNLPFLVWARGQGKIVHGEVYEIDDGMLTFADDFEGHPEVYERDRLKVTVTSSGQTKDSPPETSSGEQRSQPVDCDRGDQSVVREACGRDKVTLDTQDTGEILECWAYFLKHVRPAMLELPCLEEYSSIGPWSKEYDADEDLRGIEDIMKALADVNL